MAKYKIPSQAASGAETFSDNLVGVQITTGTPQLSNTNFALDSGILQKDDKNFLTNPFSSFLTLEDLTGKTTNVKVEEFLQAQKTKDIKFKDNLNNSNKSLYGSLKKRILVALNNIVTKFPAALLIDSESQITISGYTAFNISYDNSTKTTYFQAEIGRAHV